MLALLSPTRTMKRTRPVIAAVSLVLLCFLSASAQSHIIAGVAKSDITPPVGTPLAGYGARHAAPSTGVHDPTEARALIIDNGVEKIAMVSVDHLGFDHGMVERIRAIASEATHILPDHIFIMSSHTHSGGGAYMEMLPLLANVLAGKFDPKIRAHYEQRTAEAIIAANKALKPARIAFAWGEARGISRFRSTWPPDGPVDPEVGVIRIDAVETGKPMAVLMNFAAHPTVLGPENMTFSADFVGYARTAIERMIGGEVMAIFANGAQGTIAPRAFVGDDAWQRAENVGTILAAEVFKATMTVKPRDSVDIKLVRTPLTLKIVPTSVFPPMMSYPAAYDSEINAIAFDNRFAFVAIPGELGSILNSQVKERGKLLGFEKTFILGLTNDALGYIITEDEYRHKTYESTISLFGPAFGSFIANESFQLLERLRPVEKKKPLG
jgi:Neutral/alkaline non-lysosomal ceramidase, N-terminal